MTRPMPEFDIDAEARKIAFPDRPMSKSTLATFIADFGRRVKLDIAEHCGRMAQEQTETTFYGSGFRHALRNLAAKLRKEP